MHYRIVLSARLFVAALMLTGCAGEQFVNTESRNQFGAQHPTEVVDDVSYWAGAFGGVPSMTINLTEQKAYFYQDDQLAGIALVATGKEGFDTPSGTFRIMEKIADKHSDLYGYMYDASGNVVSYDADIRVDSVPQGGRFEGASMPYWMRLTGGGIGMHQGPIPVPGSPASHGCIRISKLVAATFFEHARVGMPVRVIY